jgi:hypothetical protein
MSATSQKPEAEPKDSPASVIKAGVVQRLFAGAPFVAIAALPGLAFGWDVAFTAFVLTVCAAFTIHMPVVAIASGKASEAADLPLSPRTFGWMLLLWTATDWGLAAIWR